jgi:murein DD-endopeptidase MepM/ murein hydrolase activator NlpD
MRRHPQEVPKTRRPAPLYRVNFKIKCREGWRVNINHGGGILTRYCHAIALNVAAGQQVTAGQIIGWVGSTGNSSGPHLHFELHRGAPPATNETATDPIPYLQAAGLDP